MYCFVSLQRITNASIQMHDAMLSAVLRAPILFFDSNPVGRVLNRFAKDIAINDNMMPEVMFDFSQMVLMVISSLVIVSIGNFYVIFPLIPMVVLFIFIREYYMKTTREVGTLLL